MKRIVPVTAFATLLAGTAVGVIAKPPVTGPSQAPAQVVKLRLTAGGRELAKLSTPDGTMATMARSDGEAIALTPLMQADVLTLTVAVKDPASLQLTVVGRYSLVRNVPTDVSTARTALRVEWLETTAMPPVPGAVVTRPCRTCCVVCEGVTFCACEVTTGCGRCCCKDACGCESAA